MSRYQEETGAREAYCAQCHGDFIHSDDVRRCGTCGLKESESRVIRAQEAEQRRLNAERNARLQQAIEETNRPVAIMSIEAQQALQARQAQQQQSQAVHAGREESASESVQRRRK